MKLKVYNSKRENYHLGHRFDDLKNIVEIQLNQGDCLQTDEYMRGMANGLLLAWNTMTEPYDQGVKYIEPHSDFVKAQDLLNDLRDVLLRFANIEADNGDDFEGVHEDVIIRVECTAGDLHAARDAVQNINALI